MAVFKNGRLPKHRNSKVYSQKEMAVHLNYDNAFLISHSFLKPLKTLSLLFLWLMYLMTAGKTEPQREGNPSPRVILLRRKIRLILKWTNYKFIPLAVSHSDAWA